MKEPKHFFAPLPNRALGDARLKGLHFRVLGAVAAHDRFGENGKGCTLSTRQLAERIGATYQKVGRACSELIAWGYVGVTPNPKHVQLRMLCVIYDDDADRRFVARQIASKDLQALVAPTVAPQGDGESTPTVALNGAEPSPCEATEPSPCRATRIYSLRDDSEDMPLEAGRTGVRGIKAMKENRSEDEAYLRSLEMDLIQEVARRSEWLSDHVAKCNRIQEQRNADDELAKKAQRLASYCVERMHSAP